MKSVNKYLFFAVLAVLFTSCDWIEINDELLERSDSSIFNKLKADRDNSSKPVDPSGPNHIVGDLNYDSTCTMEISKDCTLADSYACMVVPGGSTSGYKSYTSQTQLTIKEALSYIKSASIEDISQYSIAQCGLVNVTRYLYLLPCNGDKYGDLKVIELPAKSSEGFSGVVGIAKNTYSDQYTRIIFSPSEYTYKCAFYIMPDQGYKNDAYFALLLEINGIKVNETNKEFSIEEYNPSRERGVAVARAIDKNGTLSNKITRISTY